jgi:hypothetical protein
MNAPANNAAQRTTAEPGQLRAALKAMHLEKDCSFSSNSTTASS